MNPKSIEAAILIGIMGLWLPAAASAQTKTQAAHPDSSHPQAERASKPPAALPLKDLGGISTDEAARQAARQMAVKTKSKAQSQTSSNSGKPDAGAVLEFRVVKNNAPSDTASKDIHPKNQRKALLKDIHGTIYGASGGQGTAGHTTGAAAGASSGNGKLNIFVDGQHTQANNPGSQ